MQKIAAWLLNGDYPTGVKLYEEFGSNSFLKKQFAKHHNLYHEQTLRNELIKIAHSPLVISDNKSKELPSYITGGSVPGGLKHYGENSIIEFKPNPFIEFGTKPGTIGDKSDLQKKYLQLVKRKDRLYLEINILRGELIHLPEGFLLRDCAKNILQKHQQLTEAWEAIDYYQVHQNFPLEQVAPKKQAIDPDKEIQLLRSSISKANGRLKKPNCRDREKTEETLSKNKSRLAELLANRT